MKYTSVGREDGLQPHATTSTWREKDMSVERLLREFVDALDLRPHLTFELGYTRVTDWMVHIHDRTGGEDKKIVETQHPDHEAAAMNATEALVRALRPETKDVIFDFEPPNGPGHWLARLDEGWEVVEVRGQSPFMSLFHVGETVRPESVGAWGPRIS